MNEERVKLGEKIKKKLAFSFQISRPVVTMRKMRKERKNAKGNNKNECADAVTPISRSSFVFFFGVSFVLFGVCRYRFLPLKQWFLFDSEPRENWGKKT